MTSDLLKALHFLKKARDLLKKSDDFSYAIMATTLGSYIETLEEDLEDELAELANENEEER